ncbi:MAG TPA: hypothetical protein VKU77_15820 [Streptosporangiaceae bacterium]|nr:hypothetical protein [Streptosporangiaceae bacterium]
MSGQLISLRVGRLCPCLRSADLVCLFTVKLRAWPALLARSAARAVTY